MVWIKSTISLELKCSEEYNKGNFCELQQICKIQTENYTYFVNV